MTPLLAHAFAGAARLPPEDQDMFAAWLLESVRDEQRWAESFARSQDVLTRLTDEALTGYREGRTLSPDCE